MISSTPSKTATQCASQGRKRRRAEVPNPANTLDGLVQRRVEEGKGLSGRYLTENEAIESPEDHQQVQPVPTGTTSDPDVSARTCSICGYQGKWVSEMIRHKRVHTPDRPFKCRYCSRTSKWKADLIRHVAKTHGIRVVSKYSRSKAFDPKKSPNPAVFTETRVTLPPPLPQAVPQRRMLQIYACNRCPFETEHLSIFHIHSNSAHHLSQYSCLCGHSFETIEIAQEHCQKNGFPTEHMSANFTIRYQREAPSVSTLSPIAHSDSSADSGVHSDTDDSEQETFPASTLSPAFNGIDPLFLSSLFPLIPLPSPSHPISPLPLSSPSPFLLPQFDLSTLLLALQAQAQANLGQIPLVSPSENSAFSPARGKKMVEKEADTKDIGCSLCEAVFSSHSSLSSHLSFHGSSRPHQCPNCNYAAGKRTNLHRHTSTHHRQFPTQILTSLPEIPEEQEEEEEEEMSEEDQQILDVEL
ncbi:unnamed protein product, partial [Mesorhabditis belari]|uniref:C2H2-type domain-containing protein n=1 Tax=Mesorhabditis belari TaxID=2138241 RepID=A0AAF3F1P0_9BILA